MILAKTTARIVKPWICLVRARCSGLKQTTYFPRWPAVTRQLHQSRWVFGKSTGKDHPTLDAFIGTWHETKRENYDEYLQAAGIEDPEIKIKFMNLMWISYERSGKLWIYSYGLLNSKNVYCIQFEMAKEFASKTIDGEPTKSFIFRDGAKIMELHETENPPNRLLIIQRVIKEKDTMIVKLGRDEVEAVRIYKRVPDDPEQKVTFET